MTWDQVQVNPAHLSVRLQVPQAELQDLVLRQAIRLLARIRAVPQDSIINLLSTDSNSEEMSLMATKPRFDILQLEDCSDQY